MFYGRVGGVKGVGCLRDSHGQSSTTEVKKSDRLTEGKTKIGSVLKGGFYCILPLP